MCIHSHRVNDVQFLTALRRLMTWCCVAARHYTLTETYYIEGTPRSGFCIKISSYQYWKSHCRDIKINANDFHEWQSHEFCHEWKSLTNRLTSDPKFVIHGNECIILFLTCYFMSWIHNSAENNYRSLISPLSLWTIFSDLVLWRHHSWSVTSHERTTLSLWRHICLLLLHAQIGAKAIFTSE